MNCLGCVVALFAIVLSFDVSAGDKSDIKLAAEAQESLAVFISEAKKSSSEIAALARQANAALQTGDYEKYSALKNKLNINYPGVWIALRYGSGSMWGIDDGIETNQAKIQNGLKKEITEFLDNNVAKCFDSSGKWVSGSRCDKILSQWCYRFGSSERGLTASRLQVAGKIIDVEVVPINERSELDGLILSDRDSNSKMSLESLPVIEKIEHIALDRNYYFCRAASFGKAVFLPKSVFKGGPGIDREFLPSPFSAQRPTTATEFDQECSADELKNLREQLTGLIKDYPSSLLFTDWMRSVEYRESSCRNFVDHTCEQTYILDGKAIYSYITEGCDFREVLPNDIDKDTELMRMSGETEASQLKHLQLKKKIDLCQSAYESGYRWVYKRPSLEDYSESCVKPVAGVKEGKKKKSFYETIIDGL